LIAQRFFLRRVYEPLHRSCGKTTGLPMSCAIIARVHETSGLGLQPGCSLRALLFLKRTGYFY